ncbi:hypothetical protein DAI22_09g030250 [Oryza sativa Japonica Group]|nr:hypothetical protein DAI22_09g030250 [Oryza sativa Japonica Group]
MPAEVDRSPPNSAKTPSPLSVSLPLARAHKLPPPPLPRKRGRATPKLLPRHAPHPRHCRAAPRRQINSSHSPMKLSVKGLSVSLPLSSTRCLLEVADLVWWN